ncbi:hypothetical protein D3C72_2256740 [compost metagenome]
MAGFMPLVVLFDPSAFGLPALDHLGAPGLNGLLSDDGVIKAAIRALHPAAQRAIAVTQPLLRHPPKTGQLR